MRDLLWVDPHQGCALIDEVFFNQIHRNLERGPCSSLRIPGLKDKELLVLDGEFYILNIGVVALESAEGIDELFVDFWLLFFE